MPNREHNEAITALGILGIAAAFLYAFMGNPTSGLAEVQPGQYLMGAAADAFLKMASAAELYGINLHIVSSYRTADKQIDLWNKALKKYKTEKEAMKWTAKPGTSNHEKGIAVDIKLSPDILNDSANVSKLEKTDTYKWLAKNASRFGFKRSPTEPWHWVYYG